MLCYAFLLAFERVQQTAACLTHIMFARHMLVMYVFSLATSKLPKYARKKVIVIERAMSASTKL